MVTLMDLQVRKVHTIVNRDPQCVGPATMSWRADGAAAVQVRFGRVFEGARERR
jgi:hypothetical protein